MEKEKILEPADAVVSSHHVRELLQKAPEQKFHKSNLDFTDKLIGGFAAGDLVVIGGNTGAGKTTFLQTLTKNFASQGIPCLWFSVELSYREFLGRFGDDLPVFYVPKVMPNATTHEWIEKKIAEAKEKYGVEVVFIDHIGMIVDESVARHQNSLDIFDARIFRLKRFALQNKVCLVAVAPLVQSHLRAKKKEPSEGDFRGTAMIAYTADTLLHLERLEGRVRQQTVNEDFENVEKFQNEYLMPTDAYLSVLKARRTGLKKMRVHLILDGKGNLIEAPPL